MEIWKCRVDSETLSGKSVGLSSISPILCCAFVGLDKQPSSQFMFGCSPVTFLMVMSHVSAFDEKDICNELDVMPPVDAAFYHCRLLCCLIRIWY